jgi:hypothetical protein
MADNVVKLSGETVEQVAYKLLVLVGEAEKKLHASGTIVTGAGTDRAWILSTFDECLTAAKGNRPAG